ncbi:MAG: tetratricopeptide repeat protein [Sphingomicrobium sp.]
MARAQVPMAAVAQPENASDAMGRYLRVLANSPRDFQALMGAGRAALDLGDAQAAAGFFGRADEVWPTSPLPQVGMGAATVLDGDGDGALIYFARAQQLGAAQVMMGADRGLAYDLLGRHAEAQADYRAALAGSQASDARRRLSLSLAVTGDKTGALTTLSPLLMTRDPAAIRARALVLALTGDQNSARAAIEAAMPGAWSQMGPFIARLATLNSAQKVAAVNLGIFPGSGQPAVGPMASVTVTPPAQAPLGGERLAEIDNLLRPPAVQHGPPAPVTSNVVSAPPIAATPNPPRQAPAASTSATAHKRFWVQLASGPNADSLPGEMRRIRSRSDELLKGISGYIAEEPGKVRLLVGPFRSSEDADTFAEELESMRVGAFRWVSPAGQPIRKLTNE